MKSRHCKKCGWRFRASGDLRCEACGHDERSKTLKIAGAKASAIHSRSGALDKPEVAHDIGRAVMLNQMQRSPREDFELRLTSASLFALLRLALAPAGWLQRESVTGSGQPCVRADVAALLRAGLVNEITKGYEVTAAGNDVVRELVVFAQRKGVAA